MATYQELFVLRNGSTGILGRFIIALERAATAVVREDPASPGHAERMEFAKRALIDEARGQHYASVIMRLAIAENETLQNQGVAISDADIQTIINTYAPLLIAAGV